MDTLLIPPAVAALRAHNNHHGPCRSSQELWEEKNLAVVDEILDPQWVGHDAMPGMPSGPQGLKALAARLQGAFPDGQSSIDDIMTDTLGFLQ